MRENRTAVNENNVALPRTKLDVVATSKQP